MSLPVASWGETLTAASCSLADVSTAYSAASVGDTLVIPAGSCTWTLELPVGKALTIIGAGSGAGGTKLTASGAMTNGFFHVTGFTSSNLVRISGFYFELTNLTSHRAIKISNVSLAHLRIDNNKFTNGYEQIEWAGSKGAIDHNDFYNPMKAINFTAGTEAQANASWDSMTAGTEDALFVEDNRFIDDSNFMGAWSQERIGTYNGGKLVVRYNHFDSYDFPLSTTVDPIMTHGSAAGGVADAYWQQGTGARRGQSVVEIYNNVMEGKRIDFPVTVRGSSNLIYNNTVTLSGGFTPRIYLREEEYTISQWNPLRTEWPAEDQVHNTFIWNNTYNGAQMNSANIVVVPDDVFPNEKIKEGRDYFLHAPEATGGKETFTGANGASGSFPTDGVEFPTLGTMVFSTSGPNAHFPYVPYTYPHPITTIPEPPKILPVQ